MYKTLHKAIATYGEDAQLDMCVEEMSELTKEIIKKKRGKNNREALLEELADVTIMLEQLKMITGIKPGELHAMIQIKVHRLKERMEQ